MLKKDGVCYYCNIASPAVLQYDHVSYIDYDLDAKLFPTGDIRVLDEKEYLTHKKTYKYSDELDTVLKFSTRTVLRRMVSHQFPFVDEKIFEYYNQFNELIKK
jgi:protein associated with RNAse G/E